MIRFEQRVYDPLPTAVPVKQAQMSPIHRVHVAMPRPACASSERVLASGVGYAAGQGESVKCILRPVLLSLPSAYDMTVRIPGAYAAIAAFRYMYRANECALFNAPLWRGRAGLA